MNSLYGNILTKIIICISTEKVFCITRLENVLQVLALVTPRLTPLRLQTVLALAK
jgi:hypothetical protein